MIFKKYIPKDQIKNYPIKNFSGRIFVVEKEEDVKKACLNLKKHKVLGFDTESKPTFKKGVTSNVSLLQLSTIHEAFIFRINKTGLSDELIKILSDKKIKKIGIAIGDDIKALNRIKKFKANSLIDLNKVALDLGFESIGAVKLCILILGFSISKSVRLSNWEKNELSNTQIDYAATDAWICTMIYNKLLDEGQIKNS